MIVPVSTAPLVPPPYRSEKVAADWNTFFDAVKTAFDLHLKESPFGPNDTPVLVESFPKTREGKFDTGFDVIAWTVNCSQMAPSDNGGKRIPNGLRVFGNAEHPTKFGYRQVTVGWWELMESEFAIYAKSGERANVLASWFHQFMMQYAFGLQFFKQFGITYFKFTGRMRDEKNEDFGEELYVRKLRYESRISMQHAFDSKTLEGVHFGVSASGPEVASFDISD